MSNKSTKRFDGTPQARTRRANVIKRLELQLKLGEKTIPGGKAALAISDVTRIEKELETLKTRI